MATQGVSGPAVALAGAGALLVYSGLRDQSPLTTLRQVATGKPLPPVASKRPTLTQPGGDSGGGSGSGPVGGAALVAAAQQFRGDRYSQTRRWQNGYSDCSSFVGKALKAVGIRPPGASLVSSYVSIIGTHWSALHRISESQADAGDLVIAPSSHMAIVTGPGQAIGQQNPRRNVRQGSFRDLMYGTGAYSFWRISPALTTPAGG